MPRHDDDPDAIDRLAQLADRPGVRRAVRFFGVLVGIQMIIGIIIAIVVVVFFIIAVKILNQ